MSGASFGRNEKLEKGYELERKRNDLLTQQTTELAQRKKKLTQQQISMLRSRFNVSGGAGGATANSNTPQGMSDTSSSLFARITGR